MVTTFLTRGNIKITPETSLVTNAVVRPFFFFYRILVTCVVNTVFVGEGKKVFIDFDSIRYLDPLSRILPRNGEN